LALLVFFLITVIPSLAIPVDTGLIVNHNDGVVLYINEYLVDSYDGPISFTDIKVVSITPTTHFTWCALGFSSLSGDAYFNVSDTDHVILRRVSTSHYIIEHMTYDTQIDWIILNSNSVPPVAEPDNTSDSNWWIWFYGLISKLLTTDLLAVVVAFFFLTSFLAWYFGLADKFIFSDKSGDFEKKKMKKKFRHYKNWEKHYTDLMDSAFKEGDKFK
jgi:hypothetical protein